MTIHSTHPFPTGEDPVRRLRGRLGGAVSLWTTGAGADRAGLTVTSLMVAAGEPARLLGLIDPDSDLADALADAAGDSGDSGDSGGSSGSSGSEGDGARCVVQLLSWPDRGLADMFAGTAPAPGGVFGQAEFEQTPWGPRLASATTWAGVRLESVTSLGWSDLLTCVVEELVVGEDREPLAHRRGRYHRAAADA
ncbi:flavin reductase [Nocardioides sp. dk4132]|uniref:flavin reductase family protein n=1 Tax=unclassified Nocardioides TaxID=2615069 RepID=UPI001295CAD3|nr:MULTISPECIES: flavin reductase [unclassified Nocardioides]MQW76512.1 flavin reductase [Nocardioides sp. dk4132]QGA07227.1 flavin reductase [Nocardioides sp. dk884]